MDNQELYERFRRWVKSPDVRTRKDLRREFFRTRRRTEIHHVVSDRKH